MKIGISTDGDDFAEYYEATVVSVVDYYPFGSAMAGRKYNQGTYRYGVNGKEEDKEWGSQMIQDYGFRIYNPTIGKFLSVDPLTRSYPMLTPYQFASNTPIIAIDLDGLEAITNTLAKDEMFWELFSSDIEGKEVLSRIENTEDGVDLLVSYFHGEAVNDSYLAGITFTISADDVKNISSRMDLYSETNNTLPMQINAEVHAIITTDEGKKALQSAAKNGRHLIIVGFNENYLSERAADAAQIENTIEAAKEAAKELIENPSSKVTNTKFEATSSIAYYHQQGGTNSIETTRLYKGGKNAFHEFYHVNSALNYIAAGLSTTADLNPDIGKADHLCYEWGACDGTIPEGATGLYYSKPDIIEGTFEATNVSKIRKFIKDAIGTYREQLKEEANATKD